jgi:hypothetical protein
MDDVAELYCLRDDFSKDFEPLLKRRPLQTGKRVSRRVACLSQAKNMKPLKHSAFERAILSGRSLVETVFDGLKSFFLIEHTRQR